MIGEAQAATGIVGLLKLPRKRGRVCPLRKRPKNLGPKRTYRAAPIPAGPPFHIAMQLHTHAE